MRWEENCGIGCRRFGGTLPALANFITVGVPLSRILLDRNRHKIRDALRDRGHRGWHRAVRAGNSGSYLGDCEAALDKFGL